MQEPRGWLSIINECVHISDDIDRGDIEEVHFRQEQNRLVLVMLKLLTSKNRYDNIKTTNTTYSKILIAVDGSNASMDEARTHRESFIPKISYL
jgi:hypothetical protein